jgi:hypothetical protein
MSIGNVASTRSGPVRCDWSGWAEKSGRINWPAIESEFCRWAGTCSAEMTTCARPSLVVESTSRSDVLGVALAGSYAYVTDEDAGLQIIDVSDPAAPDVAVQVEFGRRWREGWVAGVDAGRAGGQSEVAATGQDGQGGVDWVFGGCRRGQDEGVRGGVGADSGRRAVGRYGTQAHGRRGVGRYGAIGSTGNERQKDRGCGD